jgi:iron complex outermembrane receptor protein
MKARTIQSVYRTWLLPFMILFALLVQAGNVSAQATIKGRVLDMDTGEPLIGANIATEAIGVGAITDLDGRFELIVNQAFPFTLTISYTGYAPQSVRLSTAAEELNVALSFSPLGVGEVVVSASRLEERILESPVTIEKMDLLSIRQSSAPEFYDDIANLKGVQAIKGSLTFTSYNTRGFGTIANERFVQLIDGMDNAAPLLNFPTGNVVGISELDALSVEVVPGAASALYGPNAFNGILQMRSKDPFTYQGLSVQTKYGATDSDAGGSHPYYQVSARYATSVGDKLAFKVNASYLKATDWSANDYQTGRQTVNNPMPSTFGAPNFDGLNSYGDETPIILPMSVLAQPLSQALCPVFAPQLDVPEDICFGLLQNTIPQLGVLDIRRTGLQEEYLLDDGKASSLKLDGAVHYKITDAVMASYAYRYGMGNTIYQGGERYVLRDFTQQYHKLEFEGDNFFVRGYTTITNDGDSYNLSALGAFANERFSPSEAAWVPAYAGTYAGALLPILLQGGQPTSEQVVQAHAAARLAADGNTPAAGSPEFEQLISNVRTDLFQGNPPGAGFVDNSRMYHAEFNYKITPLRDLLQLQLGGNFRQYDLFSDGTVFNEDPEGEGDKQRIKINEFGMYLQAGKTALNDRLEVVASLRFDKNENFEGQLTPRISGVYKLDNKEKHFLRASYQTGFRNPSTQQQFIFFPLGDVMLLGSTQANAERYGVHNGGVYTASSYNNFVGSILAGSPNPDLLKIANVSYVQPEHLQVFELGYKGIVNDVLFLDVNTYYNIYNDFISEQTFRAQSGAFHRGNYLPGVADMLTGEASAATGYRLYVNADEQVSSWGVGLGFRSKLPAQFSLYGHYNYADFSVEDPGPDFDAGFNLPQNSFLIGLNNKRLMKGTLGFDLSYRWQDAFDWVSTFARGTIDAYGILNAQVNYTIKPWKTMIKLGANNLLGNDYRTNVGGPYIGSMYYLSLTFDEMFN